MPNDSPIWNSLNESYPRLDLETKQKVFEFLQQVSIPPTDSIYPWVVETMVNRVSMGHLERRLEQTQQKLETLPSHLIQAINESVAAPIQAIQSSQSTIDHLTVELRKNSVIESSLRQSGWRGVICALEAIAQHKMLGLTVGAIALSSTVLTGWIIWGLGVGDRQIIQFNRQSIQECYDKFAMDEDRNGWFSCPGIQLPMR